MAVASMVLGIIALISAVFGLGVASWVGVVCGLLAIIFGAVAKKKTPGKNGMATAGLVMGIISLVLGIIFTVACVACFGAVAAAGDEFILESGSLSNALDELQQAIDNALNSL